MKQLCIIADSIRSGFDGWRMQINGKIVTVRCFPGSYIADMCDYYKLIIKKKPSYIILHVGTNDTSKYKPREILEKLLNLKSFIETKLPTCRIIIES